MRKIIFILLILTLLVTACNVEILDNTQETTSDDLGYIEDLDKEFDNSDLENLDEDLNLDWI